MMMMMMMMMMGIEIMMRDEFLLKLRKCQNARKVWMTRFFCG